MQKKPYYTGVLRIGVMPKGAQKAYISWKDQRYRCYNPKRKDFKYYGGKGIKVLYENREFIGWWLSQQKVLKLKNPSISRKNHSKNYSFENIELIDKTENVKEMRRRCLPPQSRKVFYKKRLFALSGVLASKKLGISKHAMYLLIKKRIGYTHAK